MPSRVLPQRQVQVSKRTRESVYYCFLKDAVPRRSAKGVHLQRKAGSWAMNCWSAADTRRENVAAMRAALG